MARILGRVAWFDTTTGYGFLSTVGHDDVYCHYSAIKDLSRKPVTKGQAVEFDTSEDGAGRARASRCLSICSRDNADDAFVSKLWHDSVNKELQSLRKKGKQRSLCFGCGSDKLSATNPDLTILCSGTDRRFQRLAHSDDHD